MGKTHRSILVFTGLLSLAPLLVFLSKFPLSPRRDWDYFNSLSLIIGDSLNKGELPLLDPWICGGIDILANPQNWIYSPFALFSLFFSPFLSNTLSLLVCAVLGFLGMFKLTEDNDDVLNRSLLATLFCLSPFFFLHFAEGHIPYRTFYFLPWILYFIRKLSLKNLWLTNLCLAFMFLDGGIYPFYFSLILICINLEWTKFFQLVRSKESFPIVVLMTVSFVLLIFAKALPVLWIHENRIPQHETVTYSLSNVVQALYDYRQSNFLSMPGQRYSFHEYGHYLGIGLSILFLLSLKNSGKNLKILFQLGLFTWIAFGIGGELNPWLLIKKIPFIKHLHVQSRFLIMLFLMMLLLINKWQGWKKAKTVLLILAVMELMFVGIYITIHSFQYSIDSRSIKMSTYNNPQSSYAKHITKPEIYSSEGRLSFQCYEPANPNLLLKQSDLFSITGLTALMSGNTMTIFDPQKRSTPYLMNYNWNGGWKCDGCEASKKQGLIEISPSGKSTEIKLTYEPVHYKFSIILLLLGLALFTYTLVKIRKTSKQT